MFLGSGKQTDNASQEGGNQTHTNDDKGCGEGFAQDCLRLDVAITDRGQCNNGKVGKVPKGVLVRSSARQTLRVGSPRISRTF